MSHQIKTLEEFLGLELFVRKTRRVDLTKAGAEYYKSIHKALSGIDLATQELISVHQSGDLNLSVIPAFLTRWLIPRIGGFHEANPDIKLDMTSTTGLIDFARSDIDMGIYFGNGEWENIEMHFLRDYQQVPVCSPELLEKSNIEEPEDLLKHTLLYVQKRQDEWPNWFAESNTPFDETKQGVFLSSSALTTEAAINGVGIALADISFVSKDIASGRLVVPIERSLAIDKSFYLVYEKDRVMTYAMTTFKNWIIKEMEKDPLSSESSAKAK